MRTIYKDVKRGLVIIPVNPVNPGASDTQTRSGWRVNYTTKGPPCFNVKYISSGKCEYTSLRHRALITCSIRRFVGQFFSFWRRKGNVGQIWYDKLGHGL